MQSSVILVSEILITRCFVRPFMKYFYESEIGHSKNVFIVHVISVNNIKLTWMVALSLTQVSWHFDDLSGFL